MTSASQANAIDRTRSRMRRSALRRHLQEVTLGKREELLLDLKERDGEVAAVLDEVAGPLACDSIGLRRLMVVFRNSGIADSAIDRLSAKSPSARRHSARILGALRMPHAVSWLAPALSSKDRSVSDAAARALGRIGGARSAQALLTAIQRSGLRRVLISELARAAPDLFLEVTLSGSPRPTVRLGAAVAAGLRRRHTAVGPLVALLMNGSARERVVSCRALGWIGSDAAGTVLTAALDDPERRVRMAAEKALRAIHARTAVATVKPAEIRPHVQDRTLRLTLVSDAALGNMMREASGRI